MFVLCVTYAVTLLVMKLTYLIVRCYHGLPTIQLMIVDFIREDVSKLMPLNLVLFSGIVTYRELIGPLPRMYPELVFVSAIVVHSLIFNMMTILNVLRCINIIRFSAVNSVMDSSMRIIARIVSIIVTVIWISLLVYHKNENSYLSPPIFLRYQSNFTEIESIKSFSLAQSTTAAAYMMLITITNTLAHSYVEIASCIMLADQIHPHDEASVHGSIRKKVIASRVGVVCFLIVISLWGTTLFVAKVSKSNAILVGLAMITTADVILPSYFIFISRKLRSQMRREISKMLKAFRPSRVQPE